MIKRLRHLGVQTVPERPARPHQKRPRNPFCRVLLFLLGFGCLALPAASAPVTPADQAGCGLMDQFQTLFDEVTKHSANQPEQVEDRLLRVQSLRAQTDRALAAQRVGPEFHRRYRNLLWVMWALMTGEPGSPEAKKLIREYTRSVTGKDARGPDDGTSIEVLADAVATEVVRLRLLCGAPPRPEAAPAAGFAFPEISQLHPELRFPAIKGQVKGRGNFEIGAITLTLDRNGKLTVDDQDVPGDWLARLPGLLQAMVKEMKRKEGEGGKATSPDVFNMRLNLFCRLDASTRYDRLMRLLQAGCAAGIGRANFVVVDDAHRSRVPDNPRFEIFAAGPFTRCYDEPGPPLPERYYQVWLHLLADGNAERPVDGRKAPVREQLAELAKRFQGENGWSLLYSADAEVTFDALAQAMASALEAGAESISLLSDEQVATQRTLLAQDQERDKRAAPPPDNPGENPTVTMADFTEPTPITLDPKGLFEPARQGDPNAQNGLGACYANGWGVAKDFAEAAKWYRKAADQGNACAQSSLAGLYQTGQGVAKNPGEAFKLYLAAARQADVNAQASLVMKYSIGDGVPADPAEMAKWHQSVVQAAQNDGSTDNFAALAWADLFQGDLPAGETHARESLDQDPDCAHAKAILGHALLLRGNRDEALPLYDACLSTADGIRDEGSALALAEDFTLLQRRYPDRKELLTAVAGELKLPGAWSAPRPEEAPSPAVDSAPSASGPGAATAADTGKTGKKKGKDKKGKHKHQD